MNPTRFVVRSSRLWGVLLGVQLLGGCSGFIAPDPEPGADPKELESMAKGAPCYFRGGIHFCAELSDADSDGVSDIKDHCPGTSKGIAVDSQGCPLDSDGDGVTDDLDRCSNTPRGVSVDEQGCPVDADGDGVTDDLDRCPDTPAGAKVNTEGCWVLVNLLFKSNQHEIETGSHGMLDEVVRVLKDNSAVRVEIQGHTDSVGSAGFNDTLSLKRAEAVRAFLIGKGVKAERLRAVGLGLRQPVATNDTEEGRARNRRVVLQPVP
ncbi:MAG: OmpA family protein [Magnetococcus sp. YQC-9]